MLRARPIFTVLISAFWLVNSIAASFAWHSMLVEGSVLPEKVYAAHLEMGNPVQERAGRSEHHRNGLMTNHFHSGMDSFGVATSDDHACCEFSALMQSHTATTSCSTFCASVCSAVMNCLLPMQIISLKVESHRLNRPPNASFHTLPANPPETPPPYTVS